MRTAYLTGSETGVRARYNKLAEHVAFSSSYLYAPGSTRFGVVMPPTHGDRFMREAQGAREELHRLWHDTDAARVFGLGVTWAHVWPSAIYKVMVSQNRPAVALLSDPADLGVLEEDVDEWDEQEALCHWYTVNLSKFWRMIQAIPDEQRRAQLWDTAQDSATPKEATSAETLPSTVQRFIILAAASPTMEGQVQGMGGTALAIPRVHEDVVRLAELWVRDDRGYRDDRHRWQPEWRVVTNLLATEEILWEPLNPLISDEHPFHALTLDPAPGYLWGTSPLEKLIALQEWREKKLVDIDERDGRQIDPPLFFQGFGTMDGERAKAFLHRGGYITSSAPNADVKPVMPPPVPDPFAFIDQIDGMFSRAGGLPKGMTGQTEPGVRSGEQAMGQAMLGSGPTMTNAMRVEGVLEEVATALLRLHRRVNGETIRLGQGADATDVLLSQLPGDFVVRVSAHSASPLYAQQIAQKAVLAKQLKAITNERFIELLDLPQSEILVAEARQLSKAQAEQSERVIEIQEAKAQKGRR